MAAIHQSDGQPENAAADLRQASFVRLAVAPSVDAIAAAGILAQTLDNEGTPYHASIDPIPQESGPEDGVLVGVGTRQGEGTDLHLPSGRATLAAATQTRVVSEAPIPALIGTAQVFTLENPSEEVSDPTTALSKEAGLGLAVDSIEDGLGHSTLVHGSFSGSEAAAAEFLDGIDPSNGRRLASAVALETIEKAPGSTRVADALGRFLHPGATPDGPFRTVAGTADVFDVLAAVAPGLALAIASGHGSGRDSALDAWRAGAERIHQGLDCSTVTTHEGCVVVQTDDAPAAPLARLFRDIRSTEPTVLVLADDRLAVASSVHADETLSGYIAQFVHSLVCHGDGRVSGTFDESPGELREHLVEAVA